MEKQRNLLAQKMTHSQSVKVMGTGLGNSFVNQIGKLRELNGLKKAIEGKSQSNSAEKLKGKFEKMIAKEVTNKTVKE